MPNLDIENQLVSLFRIGISIHNLNKRSEKHSGLSLAQWCALRQLIDMPAVTAHSLAKAVGIHPSTLTQTLKRLEKKELIFISDDPRDSRRKLITITRSGKDALENTSSQMQSWSKDLLLLKVDISKLHSSIPKTDGQR